MTPNLFAFLNLLLGIALGMILLSLIQRGHTGHVGSCYYSAHLICGRRLP